MMVRQHRGVTCEKIMFEDHPTPVEASGHETTYW